MLKNIIFLCIGVFLLASCSKEGDSIIPAASDSDQDIQTTDKKVQKFNNKVGFNYWAFECVDIPPPGTEGPPLLNGVKCEAGAVAACSRFADCQGRPAPHSDIASNFSSAEISAWLNGNLVFQQNKQWILDHYGYYLAIHQDTFYGDSIYFHPDTIIAINGW